MPAIKSKTDSNMNIVQFSWDEYLKNSDDKPAPKCCFKQAAVPPVNEFQPGMKLESRDPRNAMSFCIATVICKCGPRLCLRLDGSDNRNDFWSLVDSDHIHPYGWCESVGEQLQPPLGFAKNASSYPMFLSKLLTESLNSMAPKSCFKEVPTSPSQNLFEIGMKLEAIDRKNPHLIGPATIGDIDGDKIRVQFDGWRGAFDYWCRYDCRDIFPVGWCSSTSHPLQPPGTKGNNPRGRVSTSCKSTSVSPNMAVHIEVNSHSVGVPSPGSARSGSSKKNSPAVGKLASPTTSVTTPVSPAELNGSICVTAYVNQTCRCGPALNQTSIIRLPLQYGPHPIQRTLKKVVQALVDSANNPVHMFHSLVTAPSSTIVTAKIAGRPHTCSLPLITTETAFQAYISNLLNKIDCCINLITLQPIRSACSKCGIRPSSSGESSKRSNPFTAGPAIPVKRSRDGNMSVSSRGKVPRSLRSLSHTVSAPVIYPSNNRTADQSAYPVSESPLEWTTTDVIHYIRNKDHTLAKYAHLIQTHEIDGRALLLMTSDIAIKYMNMKVGPALKLCSLVNQLKYSLW